MSKTYIDTKTFQKQKVQRRNFFSKWTYETVSDWEKRFSDDEIWWFSKVFLLHQDTDNWYTNKNLFYILWFDPSLGTIIFDDKKVILFFDSRYFGLIQKSKLKIQSRFKELFWKIYEIEIIQIDWTLESQLKKIIKWKNIVIEDNLPVLFYKNLKKLSPENIEIVKNIFEKERLIKTSQEIKNIKKAIQIIEKVYKEIYKSKEALIWKKEIEVRQIIQKLILEYWWSWESFSSIVAFWKNSAIPHHQTWNTIIWNWPLLIDMWAIYKWYCSDFTRTFWVWEKAPIYDEFMKVKNIVKKAHDLWVEHVKNNTNITWKDLDNIVRNYIKDRWYWEYFTHSTWHGVWLQIHELPWISSKKWDQTLEKWMIFTIEPGIYLLNKFGVRWENIIIT